MGKRWETAVKAKILETLGQRGESHLAGSITTCEPLLLVDVPLKATARGGSDAALLYLPEEQLRRGYSGRATYPRYAVTPTILGESSFDEQVGKIRVFVDPDLKAIVERSVGQGDVRKILLAH